MRSSALRAGLGALIAGLVVAAVPGTASAAPACARPALAPGDEAALTAMINDVRKAQGVRAVSRHAGLLKAGRQKSMAMAAGARFEHSKGLEWAGGRAAGQNLAKAPNAQAAFQAMLASPAHRRNLLAREWRFTGVGAARNCAGVVFFTINLMAPPA